MTPASEVAAALLRLDEHWRRGVHETVRDARRQNPCAPDLTVARELADRYAGAASEVASLGEMLSGCPFGEWATAVGRSLRDLAG